MNQVELAKELNVSPSSLSNLISSDIYVISKLPKKSIMAKMVRDVIKYDIKDKSGLINLGYKEKDISHYKLKIAYDIDNHLDIINEVELLALTQGSLNVTKLAKSSHISKITIATVVEILLHDESFLDDFSPMNDDVIYDMKKYMDANHYCKTSDLVKLFNSSPYKIKKIRRSLYNEFNQGHYLDLKDKELDEQFVKLRGVSNIKPLLIEDIMNKLEISRYLAIKYAKKHNLNIITQRQKDIEIVSEFMTSYPNATILEMSNKLFMSESKIKAIKRIIKSGDKMKDRKYFISKRTGDELKMLVDSSNDIDKDIKLLNDRDLYPKINEVVFDNQIPSESELGLDELNGLTDHRTEINIYGEGGFY